jgi:multidrug efflux pump subunit AcrA (membrane-fusion protein)
LLADPVPGRCFLVAEVPETRMAGLREGQRCSVRFYADPEAHHFGHVQRILPTVSAAQRTLRVLVTLDSPQEAQRPGMFADVGIGTDLRRAVRIPAAAVVHIGHSDVVLWQERAGDYRVVQVVLGTSDETGVEVISGIQPGQILVADGAVLLKPLIADIVHAGVIQ